MANEQNTIEHGTWGGMLYSYTKGHEPQKLRNGNKYVLVFDNNEKFTYPEQKSFVPIKKEYTELYTGKKITETTMVQPKLEYYDGRGNTIFGLKSPVPRRNIKLTATTDLTYTAGDMVSNVDAYDTNHCTFNVGANNSKWFGDYVTFHNGQDNQFIGDEKDVFNDKFGNIYKYEYNQ